MVLPIFENARHSGEVGAVDVIRTFFLQNP